MTGRTAARPLAWLAACCVVPLAIGAGTRAARRPPVLDAPLVLGHLAIALDSATWHDVRASEFLRIGFAATDTEPSIEDGRTWRGIRFFGKYNYLVLAGPDPATGSRSGDVSIALTAERPDAFERIAATPGLVEHRWTGSDGRFCFNGVARYCEGAARWLVLAADSSRSRTGFHIALYGADQAAALSHLDSLPATTLTTSRFLAPYFNAELPFEYVSGATLAVPVVEITRIAAVLRRAGVHVTAEGEGAVIDLGGIVLRLIPPWAGAGVKQLSFALTRDQPANPVYRFGPRSRLRFGPGAVAVWDFNAP